MILAGTVRCLNPIKRTQKAALSLFFILDLKIDLCLIFSSLLRGNLEAGLSLKGLADSKGVKMTDLELFLLLYYIIL